MFMDNKAETQMFTPFAHTPRIEHNEHNVRAMSAPMSPNNVFFMTSSFAAKVLSTHTCFFRLQSALWPSLLHCVVFGLKCVQMALNESQLGLS